MPSGGRAPLTVKPVLKSSKLANVAYDIRGPVLDKARQMEEEGQHIIKLNIGNVAAFGFDPPDEIVQDIIRNVSADIVPELKTHPLAYISSAPILRVHYMALDMRASPRPICPTAMSRFGSIGRASTSRTGWPRSPTARSPASSWAVP